jgi:uncharacterized membrane protein
MSYLTNRFVIALLVPALLFFAGGLGKKLIRGGKNWDRRDWYLGVDAALAAMSAALINILEVFRQKRLVPSSGDLFERQQVASTVFIALSFFVFLCLLALHQNLESQDTNAKAQKWGLLLLSNGIGLGLMFGFILGVKGVE